MKNVSLTIIVFLMSICARAQSESSVSLLNVSCFDRGMTLTLMFPSYMTSPHSNLNSVLVQNGYPQISRSSVNYGMGLAYRIKRFEPGFDISMGNQIETNEATDSEILKRLLNVNVFVQYHLFREGSFTFFPLLGLSFSNINLITSKQNRGNDINSLLQNPGTSMNLQHFSRGLLTGFGLSFAEHWKKSTGILRMKFAYRISFNEGSAWESNFANINNSPVDNFPYLFIQFEMGIMANWKKGDRWMD